MGKVKGKIKVQGDKGMLIVKGETGETEYEQPYSVELGIVTGASVTAELIVVDGKNKAVSVNSIDKGQVTEISADGISGTILEKESGAKYKFKQPNLKELGIVLNDIVKYTLVNTTSDGIMALCLCKPA